MSVRAVTHLNFRGEARAALEFYRSVFGGALSVVTYGDLGAAPSVDEAGQVMWGQVAADNGFCVMAFDLPSTRPFDRGESAFYVSLRGETVDEIVALWAKLSVSGTAIVPLAPAAWSPLYGMLKDRFAVTWVVDVTTPSDSRSL